MKRILIFSLAYYPAHVGGAEVAIKEITDRIPAGDMEFDLVCLRFDSSLPRTEKIGNVTVHRIGFSTYKPSMADLRTFPLFLNKPLFQFLAAWKGYRLHARRPYDAVWAMMAHSCGVPAGIFKTFHPRVPYLLTLQEGDPIEYIKEKMRPVYPLFIRAFKKADMVQTISTFLAVWAKDMGFAGTPIVIPNAVNTKHFSQTYDDVELRALRQALGKQDGDTYLITTSRLVEKNGIADVIRALADLPASVKFLVLGVGPLEEKLKEQVRAEGLGERVLFLGQVEHKELPKYLAVSDIFIRPSLSEGMGNSFVEAMASGLPVIATQEGGIADFLFDAERNPDREPTGFAVDPRSPAQIVKQVQNILRNKNLVSRVIANAKNMAFEKYDWDLIARDMREKVFAVLLKMGGR